MTITRISAFVGIVFLLIGASASAADVDVLLKQIKQVGPQGAGNAEAAKAWRELVQAGPPAVMPALSAMDDANEIAANWLRNAVDALLERELKAGRKLPVADLLAFLKETKHSGVGRRLAYEWIVRVDDSAPKRLLPTMLNDPSAELRRDAVAFAIKQVEATYKEEDSENLAKEYAKLFGFARDPDQVDALAQKCSKHGVKVDVPGHFGFIQNWRLIAPFDNTKMAGFATAFPPEKKVELGAIYKGKNGDAVKWHTYSTKDPHGLVDLNTAIGKHMGVTAYAFAAVASEQERPVQIRAGSYNAIKIFLNGKEIFFREEYHHGMRMDQHIGMGTLQKGRNEILIKVCQNEQKEDWAQNWSFQLRVCDDLGGAVAIKVIDEK